MLATRTVVREQPEVEAKRRPPGSQVNRFAPWRGASSCASGR